MRDILYIGPLPGRHSVGGVGSTADRVLAGLEQAGFRVHAITHVREKDGPPDSFVARHPAAAVIQYVLPPGDLPSSTRRRLAAHDLRISSCLQDLVARVRPAAIVVGRPALAHGIEAAAAALGIPLIVTVPSILRWAVDGVSRFPPDVTTELYACVARADAAIAVANHVAVDLAEMGVHGVTTISNGVDIEQFQPSRSQSDLRERLGFHGDDIVVLHPSNLKPVKHATDLLWSASQAIHRDERLRYLIVGDGPDRAAMEHLTRDLGLATRVRFVGKTAHDLMPGYVNASDIVVMPSASEGMCISYLEALACEKVLLASDIDAARELIEDGRTGLLFPFANIEALTKRILALAAAPERRRQIGRNGRAKVVADHDIRQTVAAYVDLIAGVIHGRG